MSALVKSVHLALFVMGGLFLSNLAHGGPSALIGNDGPLAGQGSAAPVSRNPPSSGSFNVDAEVDAEQVMRAVSVDSPYRISEQAAHGKIRYRITMRDGIAWSWPETGEQHVEHDGDTVVLTICNTCGEEAPPDAAELQRDLRANRWADNDDFVILQFARSVRGNSVDTRMKNLVTAVKDRLDGPIDFSQYLTSREAYEAREGDCSEFAVLLAAGAKARHIPVRVVFGMAYSSRFLGKKRVFAPHMWVQAWDGKRWTSYDAGIGEFDSTHIVLAMGDGDPAPLNQAFAKLRDVQIVGAEGVLPEVAAGH